MAKVESGAGASASRELVCESGFAIPRRVGKHAAATALGTFERVRSAPWKVYSAPLNLVSANAAHFSILFRFFPHTAQQRAQFAWLQSVTPATGALVQEREVLLFRQ